MHQRLLYSWTLAAVMCLFLPIFAFGNGENVEETYTYLTPEYYYNGHWTSGDSRIVVCEGEQLTLSVLPNHLIPSWTGPNGRTFHGQNWNLGHVDAHDSGVYTAKYRYSNGHLVTTKITVDVLTSPTLSFDTTGETCHGHDGAIDLTVSDLPSGVFYELFYGALYHLPTSWPVHERDQSGISQTGFDIDLSECTANYSMRFSATLDVPTTGWYQFFTKSDDGSKLFIDGHEVVNNDGTHALRERQGWIHLNAGNHQIVVTYFERTGASDLFVKWDGPGFGKQTIPNSRLSVPYTIHWSNGSCDEDLSNIDDGTYNVNVKYGGNNCTVSGSAVVTPGNSYVTNPGDINTPNAFYCIEEDATTFNPPAFSTTAAECAGGKQPTYQWQVKSDMGGHWYFISGATNKNYNPGPTGAGSKWYRRLSKCDCGPYYYWNGVSEVRDIHVFPDIDADITSTDADCNDATGSITFTFHFPHLGQFNKIDLSVDNGHNFTRVNASLGTYTFENLAPGTYQPVAKWERAGCDETFPHVTIIGQDSPEVTDAGSIVTDNAFYCIDEGATTFDPDPFETTAATCADGNSADYQWQEKTSMSGTWTNLPGATDQNYDPVARGRGSNWYRRTAKCGCGDEFTAITNVRDIHVFPTPEAVITQDDIECDETTGSITFSYDYENEGQFNKLKLSIDAGKTFVTVQATSDSYTFDNLTAGDYQPLVKWERGDCSKNFPSVTIIQEFAPDAEIIASATRICSEESVTYTAGNQMDGATYSWDFGDNASPATATGAGPHVVTYSLPASVQANVSNRVNLDVTKGTCTDNDNDGVHILDLPDADVTSSDPTCSEENGTITFSFINHPNRSHIKFSINGVDGPFTTVADQTGSFTFDGLAPGIYDVATMWGNNQCGARSIGSVTLTDQPGPGVTATASASPIVVGTDITLTATADGGTAPFTYLWDMGAGAGASVQVTPTETTTYTVTITDANGCNDTDEVTVVVVPVATADVTFTEPTCTEANGTITLTFEDVDNRDGIMLSIDGGATFENVADNSGSFTFTGLAAGDYDVAVKWGDGLGGIVSLGTVTLTDQAGPTVDATADVTSVCEGTSAVLTASVTGGTGTISYEWSTGETTMEITVTPAMTTLYTVTVTDENGCTDEDEVEVGVNPTPSVDIVCAEDQVVTSTPFDTDICNRSQDGSFFWFLQQDFTNQSYSTFSNAEFIENIGNGTATLTATITNLNNSGLTWDLNVQFTGRTDVPTDGAPKLGPTCIGVDANPSDWYYYLNFEGVIVGTGDVAGAVVNITRTGEPFQIGTGANLKNESQYGASAWFDIEIIRQPNNTAFVLRDNYHGDFNFQLTPPTPIRDCFTICAGESTKLTASVDGDAADFSYSWSNGGDEATIMVAPTQTTNYTVTITDANGCQEESSVEVIVNEAPQVNISKVDATCEEANGSAVAMATPSAGAEYEWNTGATTAAISDLAAGGYIVTVTTDNTCETIESVIIETTVKPNADIVCATDQVVNATVTDTDICNRSQDAGFFWLLQQDFVNESYSTFSNAEFIENLGDGTATLTGTITNLRNPNLIWEVDVQLSGRTDVASEGSPKLGPACRGANVDASDWYYYMDFSGVITGSGDVAGAVVNITRTGEPFQIGTGANLKNGSQYGASAWFDNDIVSQPTNPAFVLRDNYHGDFNIQLSTASPLFDCTNIVQGQTSRLSAVAGGGSDYSYEWSTGETTEEISVSPVVTTTYSVTITDDATGCSAVASQTITVGGISSSPSALSNTDATGVDAIVDATFGDVGIESTAEVAETELEKVAPAAPSFNAPQTAVNLSEEFALSQNMPNPFQGTTRIMYTLPNAGNVKFVITDMTGRQIKEINREGSAGVNTLTFEAETLRNGTYVYMLLFEGKRATRRMIVIN